MGAEALFPRLEVERGVFRLFRSGSETFSSEKAYN